MRVADGTIVILSCFGLLTSTSYVLADGAIGCLFSKALCKPNAEWCYNDFAFGKCVSLYEGEPEIDLYQYDLNEDSFYLLKRELEKLIKLGYRWSHFYTQCVLKALLFAFRYQKEFNKSACEALSEEDPSLTYFRQNIEIDPKSLGQVQFTPSVLDPHAEYADEIYIPEFGKGDKIEETIIPFADVKLEPNENYVNDFRRTLLLSQINKNKRSKENSRFDITEADEVENEFPADYALYLNELAREETPGNFPFSGYIEPIKAKIHFTETYNTPDHFRAGVESRDYDKDVDVSISENIFDNGGGILNSFSQNYNTPEKFRNGHETKDEVFYPKLNEMIYLNQPNGYFYPEGRQLAYDQYNSMETEDHVKNMQNNDGVFTEGGVVYLREEEREPSESDSLEELVNTYGNWGFKRPERLDVKKPGPSFNTNNYAFQTGREKEKTNGVKEPAEKNQSLQEKLHSKSQEEMKEGIKIQPEKKKGGSPMESPSLRKTTTTVQPIKEKETADEGAADDNEFTYITLKNRINTWQEGSRIIRKIENVLRLSQNTFSEIRVSQNEVKFKVEKNRLNLNASEVAKRINANKDAIQRLSGVEIVSAQVGNQTSLPSSTNLLEGDERQLWMLSFLLCGVIAAVAIAGTAFFIIRRHTHHKEKIKNLTQLDSEASKDYQELCRARMAVKAVQEKPEGNVTAHRITNIVKETDGSNHSPSSRSSTSSWSEEPALTNMDISTGHMVLSYMEDHLKNKDRLEQEWIALCAYEAEPSATTIATKGENGKKNRYGDVVPYDHARVLLNELSNISGSDYINASTITDHDPRNPAYIVTQGPLENTAADFWQMVWEQGSVVMVMLTRLTENGNSLCHRYWPEEGSELYHIYEVHLVSEHIWCDDYLVRSFYLKNIKTGETRTVTQFHFLSWPENGIPLSTKALLEFRRKVNKSYRGRSCPIVVHCSDGAGRSGTYCLIDMVLNRMSKGAKEIDIAATLEHIRDQRALMVRTKQQFEFVLMAVAEEVHAILKALPANPNHSPPPVVKEKE